MKSQLELLEDKIFSIDSIKPMILKWKYFGEKIVFTNGCFDILHLGHIEYLAKAADLGNHLVVGLNTDSSIHKLKGPQRPVISEQARQYILASLKFVDAVILFDEETPYNLIASIIPDILVKGDDYKAEEIVGYDIVKNNGGEVRTITLTPGYSSSSIIKKIQGI